MRTQPSSVPPEGDSQSAAVLDHARREVQHRRMTAAIAAAQRQRPWRMVTVGLTLLLSLLVLFWPTGTLTTRLRWLMQGVCDQVNNLPAWEGTLPLDARCTGISTALLTSWLVLLARGRGRATALPPRSITIFLVGAIAAMTLDGVNSVFHAYGMHLYPPQHALRLVTGLVSGLAFATLGWPLVASGFLAPPQGQQRVLSSWRELGASLGLLLLLGILAWYGAPWLWYPLALFSVAGMVAGLFLVNLAALMLVEGLSRRVLVLAQLARPAALGLALTAGELVGLAWLRTVMDQYMTG